ncbi:MAG: low molecular weight phosphotyrosine protein phosphatase [Pseudomonadota bacterium]|nr:low molecular weight phosphotyrosine protein phosphatase [Pseudomonadota bacterium]
MGNICRSPTAEGVFRALVANAGLTQSILIDSAATHDYQLGEPPDRRAITHARRRGYDLSGRCARCVDSDDFRRFEWILAMDMDNLRMLHGLRPADYTGYLGLFLDFMPGLGALEVPDPYYGAAEDFERVLDLVERGAAALLDAVRTHLPPDRQ